MSGLLIERLGELAALDEADEQRRVHAERRVVVRRGRSLRRMTLAATALGAALAGEAFGSRRWAGEATRERAELHARVTGIDRELARHVRSHGHSPATLTPGPVRPLAPAGGPGDLPGHAPASRRDTPGAFAFHREPNMDGTSNTPAYNTADDLLASAHKANSVGDLDAIEKRLDAGGGGGGDGGGAFSAGDRGRVRQAIDQRRRMLGGTVSRDPADVDTGSTSGNSSGGGGGVNSAAVGGFQDPAR